MYSTTPVLSCVIMALMVFIFQKCTDLIVGGQLQELFFSGKIDCRVVISQVCDVALEARAHCRYVMQARVVVVFTKKLFI